MAGVAPDVRRRRSDDVLSLVGLTGLAERRVAHLSGGEQQRVALARALAPAPRLLMLDEPLGSLDRALRDRLLDELRDLLEIASLPTLYVTHDHDEAFALADRVVVLRDGRVAQQGSPRDVWSRPADEWVAAFLGFLPAVDAEIDGDEARTPWGLLHLSGGAQRPLRGTGASDARVGRWVRMVLRPGALRADPDGDLVGRVERVVFLGDRTVASVRIGDGPAVEVAAVAAADAPPVPGSTLRLSVEASGILVYPPREQERR